MVIDNTSDVYPSKYISAADLKGRHVTVTIRRVDFVMMKDRGGVEKRKPVLSFSNDRAKKGWPVNVTNWKVLQGISKNYNDWIGKTIELSTIQTVMGEGIAARIVTGANGNGGGGGRAAAVFDNPPEPDEEPQPPDDFDEPPGGDDIPF